jgi:hypothetical protein
MDKRSIEKPASDSHAGIADSSVPKNNPPPGVRDALLASVTSEPPAPKAHVSRIAVIGVHGVGHHEPGATAKAMADLLLSLPANDHDTPRYFTSFQSVGIQLPLQPLAVYPPAEEDKPHTTFGQSFEFLQEESASFARTTRGYGAGAPEGATRGFAGHEFMRRMLYRYRGGAKGNAYVTTRLEGKREVQAPGGAAQVHIYEVSWADLARPANGFLSFLLALFQLIFHLGSLSRLAIDTGASRNGSWLWIVYRRTHRYAVRMLQIPIPLLKLVLLIALYSCIPALLPSIKEKAWFPIALGAMGGVVTCFLLLLGSRKMVRSGIIRWAMHPVVAALAGGAVASLVFINRERLSAPVASLEGWLSGVLLLWFLLVYYGEVRKGVAQIACLIYGISFFVFLGYLGYLVYGWIHAPASARAFAPANWVPQATLWAVEWIIMVLRASWIILVLLAFLAMVLGAFAWRSVHDPDDRAKARAAVRTSRFALAIPCLMFLLITTLIWANLFALARKVQDPFLQAENMSLPPGGEWLPEFLVPNPNEPRERAEKPDCSPGKNCDYARVERDDAPPTSDCDPKTAKCRSEIVRIKFFDPATEDYIEGVLAWSVTPGFPILLALASSGFLLMVWWALPSILTEKLPLRNKKKPPRNSTNAQCLRLGSWISRGLDSTSLVTFLIWSAIFVAPLYYFYPTVVLTNLKAVTAWIVAYFIGATLAAGALAALVKYSSPVLETVLDVDTYLRTSPADATPRAKIVERYVSLLRYIAGYCDPIDGRGYDSVVIVAHSLGSLISVDLLRFLHAEGDVALARLGLAGEFDYSQVGESQRQAEFEITDGRMSLKLLTMGNPTRQLLNRFFPYLYDWVRENPDNGMQPLPSPVDISPVLPPIIAPDTLPDPAELGVTTWVNLYRSGDYVGRSLWLTEWYRRTIGGNDTGVYPESLYVASSEGRSEMCIGAGAHTHYWDDTAPDVAEQLDALI